MHKPVDAKMDMTQLQKLVEQQAEKIARLEKEQAVETALERVRARSMAMQKSSELSAVSTLLFKELNVFCSEILASGVVLCDRDPQEQWMCGPDMYMLPAIHIPKDLDEVIHNLYKAWESKTGLYSEFIDLKKLKLHNEALMTLPEIKAIFEHKPKGMYVPHSQTNYAATFEQGYLLVITEKPFDNEEIFIRFAKAFEQTYTRFLDLQKAEAQAREAQIEAALERVRSSTMAMQRSTDLQEVTAVMYDQMESLGLAKWGCSILICHEKNKEFEFWLAEETDSDLREKYMISGTEHSFYQNVWKKWEDQSPPFSLHHTDEYKREIDEYWLYKTDFVRLPEEVKLSVLNRREVFIHYATMRYGLLNAITYESISDELLHTLDRFAKVFEQTYTRFLDLEKAEAQAREAQIEAALERVRARTMAMHKSEELSETASVMFQELVKLGGNPYVCAFAIINKKTENAEFWMCDAKGSVIPKSGFIPTFKEEPHFNKVYEEYITGAGHYYYSIAGDELKMMDQWVVNNTTIPLPENYAQANIIPPEELHFFIVYFSHGYLLFSNYTTFNGNEKDVFLRFGKIFQQTYTRFLDLEKAEAQAREAQVEAALERVRAASMAMHNSEELASVALIFFKQIEQLGIPINATSVNLVNESLESYQLYFANENDIGIADELAIKDFWFARESFSQLKKGEKEFTIVSEGSQLKAQIAFIKKEVGLERGERLEKANPEKLFIRTVQFHGLSHTIFTSIVPFSEDTLDVLRRMTRVFGMSYIRFLDLLRTEAQAREAQIEVALERVRSASMAMHSSQELLEVIKVLSQQILDLGVRFTHVSFGINTKKEGFHFWTSIVGSSVPVEIHVPAMDSPIHQNIRSAQKEGVGFFTDHLSAETNDAWTAHLQKHSEVPILSEDQLQIVKGKEINRSVVILPKIFLILAKYSQKPFSTEENEIIKRMALVFEQVYTRFLDLQKAEKQAKEAFIEAALERVRATSMAMHQSDQLLTVVTTLFNELKKLEIEIIQAFINIIHRKEGRLHSWLSPVEGANEEPYFIDVPSINFGESLIKGWLKEEKMDHVHLPSQAHVDQWITGMDAMTGGDYFSKAASLISVSNMHLTASNFKYGQVALTQRNPATKIEIEIIQRFGKVFEQSYIRFLDIQKAEAQAREAQIEAALERVRAASMAMHHSNELSQTGGLLFKQMIELGIQIESCWINLIDPEKNEIQFWTAQGDNLGEPLVVLGTDNPNFQYEINTWKNPDIPWIQQEIPAKEAIIGIKKFFGYDIPNPNGMPIFFLNQIRYKYGYMGVSGWKKATQEELEVIQRFAKVFEQTYTRFLDLQKAEIQTQKIQKVNQENERLLHSILPETIADQIKRGKSTVVKRFDQVSILFADIVGFTVLSEKISPQEVVEILNGLFSLVDDLTDHHGLEKIKTIGDAYMVASGVPEEKEDHAQVLFAFAQDMLQALKAYNRKIGKSLKVRIGICSGPVIAGVIGKKKFAYDLWGDTVNTASRMEAYGRADCIQLAPATYEILKADHHFEKIPDVMVKGKGKMDVYLWEAIN